MHETLVDAAKEMRKKQQTMSASSKPPASGISPPVPPVSRNQPVKTVKVHDPEVLDDAMLGEGLKTSRETGVGMITSELLFLDASPSLAGILTGDEAVVLKGRALSDFSAHSIDIEYIQNAICFVRDSKFGEHILPYPVPQVWLFSRFSLVSP